MRPPAAAPDQSQGGESSHGQPAPASDALQTASQGGTPTGPTTTTPGAAIGAACGLPTGAAAGTSWAFSASRAACSSALRRMRLALSRSAWACSRRAAFCAFRASAATRFASRARSRIRSCARSLRTTSGGFARCFRSASAFRSLACWRHAQHLLSTTLRTEPWPGMGHQRRDRYEVRPAALAALGVCGGEVSEEVMVVVGGG